MRKKIKTLRDCFSERVRTHIPSASDDRANKNNNKKKKQKSVVRIKTNHQHNERRALCLTQKIIENILYKMLLRAYAYPVRKYSTCVLRRTCALQISCGLCHHRVSNKLKKPLRSSWSIHYVFINLSYTLVKIRVYMVWKREVYLNAYGKVAIILY